MDPDAEAESGDAKMDTASEFTVSRDGTVLVTLHEGTDTTARSAAASQLTDSLEELATASTITDWVVGDADVYEHPAGPFDPYTVAVAVTVTVTVTAADATAAESIGADAIDEALETADIDGIADTASPVVSAA